MRTARATLFGAALAATGGMLARAQQVPSFRATIDVVSLNVTVAEGGLGTPRYVPNLKVSDFEVYENGVKQDITVFNGTNAPIALALLMDSSASMESKLQTAQEAAIGFARRLRPQDLAEIIDFDNRTIISQAFTNDAVKLEHAIRQASAGGPTSLYQALYTAIAEFKKLKKVDASPEEPRRQAVVLLSDGEDTTSMFSFDDILDIVKKNETAIYAIGLHSADDASSKGFKKGEFELRQLADQTGGKAFFPQKLGDLTNVYGEISDELSSQYTLGYTSNNQRRDGTWRRVIVRARPGTTARTKQGYFASKN